MCDFGHAFSNAHPGLDGNVQMECMAQMSCWVVRGRQQRKTLNGRVLESSFVASSFNEETSLI